MLPTFPRITISLMVNSDPFPASNERVSICLQQPLRPSWWLPQEWYCLPHFLVNNVKENLPSNSWESQASPGRKRVARGDAGQFCSISLWLQANLSTAVAKRLLPGPIWWHRKSLELPLAAWCTFATLELSQPLIGEMTDAFYLMHF